MVIKMIRKLLDKTFWKFICVGIINTIVGTTVMFVFYNCLEFNYWISSVSNYIVGSIVSFFLNKYFTFNNKEKSLKQVLKFIVNIAICYFIAYGLARPIAFQLLGDMSVEVKDNIAMLIGMVIFVGTNYLMQRFWTFKRQDEDE